MEPAFDHAPESRHIQRGRKLQRLRRRFRSPVVSGLYENNPVSAALNVISPLADKALEERPDLPGEAEDLKTLILIVGRKIFKHVLSVR